MKLTNKDFCHLHCHTELSNIRGFKDSTVKPKELIKYANDLGNKAVAITDHGNISAFIKGINALNNLKKDNLIDKDFKLILGEEIYLTSREELNKTLHDRNERTYFYHFILLAKDLKGCEQLRKINSIGWKDNYFSYLGQPRTPIYYEDIETIIGNEKGHIVASTACLGSYMGVLSGKLNSEDITEDEEYDIKSSILDYIDWCIDVFGEDNFYLEMQPNVSEEQVYYNTLLSNIAKSQNLQMIITTDVHYLDESVKQLHKAFLTSDDESEEGSKREVDYFYDSTHFFDVKDIYTNMGYLDKDTIDKAILNTSKIAAQCETYDWFHSPVIPLTKLPNKAEWYPIDKTLLNKSPNLKKMYEDKYLYHTYLVHQIFKGLDFRHIKEEDYDKVFNRIDVEANAILKTSEVLQQPVGAYLTTMQKNVELIWQVSLVGCGRGSGVGFIINYLLGITDVNPLTQGLKLQHWRFINPERVSYPDIDIDIASHLKNTCFKIVKEYYESIGGTCVRVATFRTEAPKSSVLTACRGLGINNDIASYISSLVPVERGKAWSIEDCYYGNKDKGREPVKEFVKAVDNYKEDKLLETILSIEGLITGCGSHSCGILTLTRPLEDTSSYLRTPSGEFITSFDLHEEEQLGAMKFDFLVTNGISMIQLTMEMLIKNGYMKWQGTLRDTYNKYLHPNVIDRDNKELWDLINNRKVLNLFQFESPIGVECILKLKPTSLLDLANANSLMRLMNPNGEQPLDKYIRFKANPQLWEDEMIQYGLNEEERKIMHEQLDSQYGVCSNQEDLMEMLRNPKISNFTLREADLARKAIGKKDEIAFNNTQELFYKKGKEIGTRQELLDYVWNVQVMYQKGYAFSLLHCCAYSLIGLQEAYLVYKYPPIYWYTANLLSISESITEEVDVEFDTKDKAINYGKIAKAISIMQKEGIKIALPNINQADLIFTPREEDNSIIFGLKGVSGINNEVSKYIIDNRPYANVMDFYKRLVLQKRKITTSNGKEQLKSYVTNKQLINLIKCGAFDEIEDKPREEILVDFLHTLYPPKTSLTMQNINTVLDYGIVTEDYKRYIGYYNFKNYIYTNLPKTPDENSNKIKWLQFFMINTDDMEYVTNYLEENFLDRMEEDKGYRYNDEGIIEIAIYTNRKGSFENAYNELMDEFKTWLNTPECLNLYNDISFKINTQDILKGNRSSWEMDTLSMYYSEHELVNVDKEYYNVDDFNQLSEEPIVVGYYKYQNTEKPLYKLNRIMGTVLDKNKSKHMISLLTLDGVVNVKFYKQQFTFYDKNISIDTEDGKKVTLEEGWFKKGTKLFVNGYRNGDKFIAKKYKDSIYHHTVQKITNILDDNKLTLQNDRVNVNQIN